MKLKRVYVRRLLKLAKHLETNVKPERFDMWSWTCGATACALGHACTIPHFKRNGLHLCIGDYPTPTYQSRTGFMAGATFFGLSYDQAVYLFDSDRYAARSMRSPKIVARRIRGLVRRLTRSATH